MKHACKILGEKKNSECYYIWHIKLIKSSDNPPPPFCPGSMVADH
jgi:hypothetical protein